MHLAVRFWTSYGKQSLFLISLILDFIHVTRMLNTFLIFFPSLSWSLHQKFRQLKKLTNIDFLFTLDITVMEITQEHSLGRLCDEHTFQNYTFVHPCYIVFSQDFFFLISGHFIHFLSTFSALKFFENVINESSDQLSI